jgi:hypothetical protein
MTKAHLILATEVVMLLGVVLWVGWDVYAATRGQEGVTISAVTWATIRGNPWIPFLVGFVCGHLFWQSSGN